MSNLESALALHLRAAKAAEWEREYRFAAEHVGQGKGIRARLQEAGLKDWRFDFAWPELKLAVEVEGGGWVDWFHRFCILGLCQTEIAKYAYLNFMRPRAI